MISKIIFLLLFSTPLLAIDPNCNEEGDLGNVANQLSIPNCLKKEFLLEKEKKEFCTDCATDFEKKYPEKIQELSKKEMQEKFFKTAFEEYKKSVTSNLIEAAKLSALPDTGSNFKKATDSCKWKSINDFAKECNSKAGLQLLRGSTLLNDLQNEVSNELAKIISTSEKFSPQPTLLRRNTPACFISERQLLYLTSSTLEEAFSSDLMNAVKTLDPSKYKTIDDLLLSDAFSENYDGDISELKTSLRSHPYLNQYFKSPSSVIALFKNITSPTGTNSLREFLYSKKAGEDFDSQLAKNCSDSFSGFKEAICSQDFEDGSFNLNPVQNYSKLFKKELPRLPGNFSSSEEALQKNLELVRLCKTESTKNKLSLIDSTSLIGNGLPEQYKNANLELFQISKYDNEFGKINESLCNMDESKCIQGTFTCQIFKKFKLTKTPNTLESKLANSSNNGLNSLLRSMLGDTTKIDPKTKEILVTNGILPKEDGSFVPQPDIPERKPEYFSKLANNVQTPAVQQTATRVNPQDNSSNSSRSQYQDQGSSNYSNYSSTSTPSVPDLSDVVENTKELRSIQDEIKRRLTDFGNKPVTKEAAKKVINDSFKSQGQTISPAQIDSLADRMMAPQTQTQVAQALPEDKTPSSKAQVSDGPTLKDKWKKDQETAALMGMAGARHNERSPAGEAASVDAKPKDLTKVALNIPDEPSVTLSEMFNKKIDRNDPETQLLKVLLRSNNNFLLQVKSLNFRIVFSEKNKFNVLLESGDKKEAERLRPQLEMFLKKLKT